MCNRSQDWHSSSAGSAAAVFALPLVSRFQIPYGAANFILFHTFPFPIIIVNLNCKITITAEVYVAVCLLMCPYMYMRMWVCVCAFWAVTKGSHSSFYFIIIRAEKGKFTIPKHYDFNNLFCCQQHDIIKLILKSTSLICPKWNCIYLKQYTRDVHKLLFLFIEILRIFFILSFQIN